MKFLSSLILTITIFMSVSTYAQVINSQFRPAEDITHIKEGDLIEATLTFWPIENADLSQFKKLEKTVLFNALFMAQILSLNLSPNNADVVELKAVFIVKSARPQSLFVFKYNETPIEMRIEGVKISELKDKGQEYIVLDQSVNGPRWMMIFLGLAATLVIIAILKRKDLKEFIIRLRPDATKKAKKKYDELFRIANKREDFENIYKEKEIWLKLLEERAPAHNEFFKVLNQYQFKKDWSNEDYSEVRSSFDVIRRSFEK